MPEFDNRVVLPHQYTQPFVFNDEAEVEGRSSLETHYNVRTICNLIRRIDAEARNPTITRLCAEAIWMAKRMDNRLKFYHRNWEDGLWLPETEPWPEP